MTTDRRAFLAGLGAAGAAIAFPAVPVAAAEQIEFIPLAPTMMYDLAEVMAGIERRMRASLMLPRYVLGEGGPVELSGEAREALRRDIERRLEVALYHSMGAPPRPGNGPPMRAAVSGPDVAGEVVEPTAERISREISSIFHSDDRQ